MEHKKIHINKFKMVEAMGLKTYWNEVPLNTITPLQNFMKIYQAVQMLLVGHRQTAILEWSRSPLMPLP
jgi:hypothetical protein